MEPLLPTLTPPVLQGPLAPPLPLAAPLPLSGRGFLSFFMEMDTAATPLDVAATPDEPTDDGPEHATDSPQDTAETEGSTSEMMTPAAVPAKGAAKRVVRDFVDASPAMFRIMPPADRVPQPHEGEMPAAPAAGVRVPEQQPGLDARMAPPPLATGQIQTPLSDGEVGQQAWPQAAAQPLSADRPVFDTPSPLRAMSLPASPELPETPRTPPERAVQASVPVPLAATLGTREADQTAAPLPSAQPVQRHRAPDVVGQPFLAPIPPVGTDQAPRLVAPQPAAPPVGASSAPFNAVATGLWHEWPARTPPPLAPLAPSEPAVVVAPLGMAAKPPVAASVAPTPDIASAHSVLGPTQDASGAQRIAPPHAQAATPITGTIFSQPQVYAPLGAVAPPAQPVAPGRMADDTTGRMPGDGVSFAHPAQTLPDTSAAPPATRTNAAPVMAQVAAALPDIAPNTPGFELALDPVELGSVKFRLVATDLGATLFIQAERGETLDLMRRNIASLQQELQDLGYRDVSFSFGTGSDRPAHPPTPRVDTPQHDAPITAPATPAPPTDRAAGGDGRLNLRL